MQTVPAISLVLTILAHTTLALDIVPTDGRIFRQCEVKGVEPDALRIIHTDGATRIPYEQLPPALWVSFIR